MLLFLLRRIAASVPVLLVVAGLVFLLLRLTPGDPAAAIVGDAGTAADIARVREHLGLNRSLASQFAIWIGHLARGDFGESFYFKMPIATLIGQRLEPTFSLAVLTIVIAIVVAVPLGAVAAWNHGGRLDRALMSFSVLGFSVPVFIVGYSGIWLISMKLGWVPAQGYAPWSRGIGPWLTHLLLPAFTVSIVYVALIARVTRAAVVEALTEDYVTTARSKGLTEMQVLVRHALANAAVPIATVIGIGIGALIGGVVVTETVFALPGLGQLTVDAVMSRDYPLIQAITLFFALIYVVVNLAVDLTYPFLDPRIRY